MIAGSICQPGGWNITKQTHQACAFAVQSAISQRSGVEHCNLHVTSHGNHEHCKCMTHHMMQIMMSW